MSGFDAAFAELLEHEGGYADHPSDPGGKTRYGITEAVARRAGYLGDMRQLPLEKAQDIYRSQYWDAARCDELPGLLQYPVFDAAVNSGVRQSVVWLQRALGVSDDGVLGPITMAAAHRADPHALRARMLGHRLRMMASLHTWPAFSRAWARRVASVLIASNE